MRKIVLVLILTLFSIQAQAASETQIKAVFLKKFTHLIEWPHNSNPNFTICVLEDDSFGRELKNIYTNKDFKTKTVKIINVSANEPIPDCQLLFIGKGTKDIDKLMKTISKRPILTVSDHKSFIDNDVMITMFLNDNRFKYIINNKVAQNVHIKISYLLLKSAVKVVK